MPFAPAPPTRPRRRRAAYSFLGVALVIAAAACSDDTKSSGDAAQESGTTGSPGAPSDDQGAGDLGAGAVVAGTAVRDTIDADAVESEGVQADSDDIGSNQSATTIAAIPETGVPGVESGDDFCRAWSEFAGSFQALATATAAAAPTVQLYRLDVGAAVVIADAVATMDAALPSELEAERTAMIDQYVGPLGRRAVRVLDIAGDALDPDELDVVGAAWLATLIERGVTDPGIAIELPAAIDEDLDAAAEQVAAAVPTLFEDPSLVTDVAIPRTVDYLTTQCPDQGTLGGLDIVSL